MIELYTWTTPNGQKVSIMLEEVGLPYRAHPIDITKGEQFQPDFLKVSPNNKIPAIVDSDNGLHLMESGAILLYLAPRSATPRKRSGFGAFSTGGSPRSSTLPAITRSPTSPFGHGSHVLPGRLLTSPNIPTSSVGTWRLPSGRQSSAGGMC